MTVTDTTARSQTESISFEVDLQHAPQKVWRALTDPALLAEWLLPVVDLKLAPGAAFTFKTQAYPGWDGTVNCRMLEIEAQRKLRYAWSVPFLDTVVTFTLTPTVGHAPVYRAIRLQAGPEEGIRRRALRLEDDGRQARRPACEDPMNCNLLIGGSTVALKPKAKEDWREETLARLRALILEADPEMIEERKWRKPSNGMAGVPVWSHDGIVCTGESYKQAVKLTFAQGASLPDPSRLFNSSLEGSTRRAIDIHEGENVDARAFKALVKAAVARNAAATG